MSYTFGEKFIVSQHCINLIWLNRVWSPSGLNTSVFYVLFYCRESFCRKLLLDRLTAMCCKLVGLRFSAKGCWPKTYKFPFNHQWSAAAPSAPHFQCPCLYIRLCHICHVQIQSLQAKQTCNCQQ